MEQKIIKTSCPRDCFGGCTMKVHIEDGKVVKLEGDNASRATDGKLCVKGMSYIDYIYSPNRVKYPMMRTGKRGEGKFERISWEYAVEKIGEKLNAIKENSGPLSVMHYCSGGCEGFLSNYYKSFFSQLGGYSTTRGNLCFPAGLEATRMTYGEAKHNAPWDLENAGLIILWGKNPSNTNVHEMKFINDAIIKGSKLITIDPIKSPSSKKSHLHISLLPGTDSALALCIINLLIERGSVDSEFIDKYTYGFDRLKEHVRKYNPDVVSKTCGISEDDIYSMVELIESSKPMTLVCGYGIQRYKNSGQTVRAISMLPALRGDIGIKGGGFRFANKHWSRLDWPFLPENKHIIRDEYPSSALGRALDGYNNPEISMLWIERANPLTMNPDINGIKKSMEKLDFIVVVDQFMTDTARYGDIVLPAQSFFEYNDIFASYWTPYLNYFQKVIEPLYESKNESQIYRMLGEYMGMDMKYLPQYDTETLNKVLKHSSISTDIEKLKEGPYIEGSCDIAFTDRVFKTPSGKIELYSEAMYTKWGQSPLPEFYNKIENDFKYPLRFLSTHARERIHSQFGDIPALKADRAVLYINNKDALGRGINDGDRVMVYNLLGEIYAYACITDTIREGVVNIYEGLPESSGASVNVLTSQEVTDIAYGATYYDCYVEVEKCQQ